jgi:hypothetical protein
MFTALQFGAHFEEVVGWRKEAWIVWPHASVWTGVPAQGARRVKMNEGAIWGFCVTAELYLVGRMGFVTARTLRRKSWWTRVVKHGYKGF